MRFYEREVRFYHQLAGVVGITTPRCLYAEIDAGSGMFALVLDDLAPARQTDQLSGLSPDDASTALGQLARLHAARWGNPRHFGLGWLQDLRQRLQTPSTRRCCRRCSTRSPSGTGTSLTRTTWRSSRRSGRM